MLARTGWLALRFLMVTCFPRRRLPRLPRPRKIAETGAKDGLRRLFLGGGGWGMVPLGARLALPRARRRLTCEAEGPAEWACYPSNAALAVPPRCSGSFTTMFTVDVQTLSLPIESFPQHVARGVARLTAQ